MLQPTFRWLMLLSMLLGFSVVGCTSPTTNNNTDAGTVPEVTADLPPLPPSLLNPSSAEDLKTKISKKCEEESKQVANKLKCEGKYRILYCQHQAGEWKELKDGCVDRCDVNRDPSKASTCKDETAFGCECGDKRCWNGTGCETE